jgi:hypothetical protein
MRAAYADPPYPGKARKYYGDHDDYGGEVDHEKLIADLEANYECWALSTSQSALGQILPFCPPPISRGAVGGGVRYQYRILSWCKPAASQPGSPNGPGPAASYGWEPVILRGGRPAPAGTPRPRDWFVCSPEMYTFREKPDEHVTGAKPPAFCRWLFSCMGLEPEDDFVDIFPGSGVVGETWSSWRDQPQLGVWPPTDERRRLKEERDRDHPQLLEET